MKSKKRAKSKGNQDTINDDQEHTQKRIKPVLGRPVRKYRIGELISIPYKYFRFTNARIFGYEWGGDHKNFRKDVWLYVAKPDGSSISAELIPEDEIIARIPE